MVKLVIDQLMTIKKLNINEMGVKKIKIEQGEKAFTIIKSLTVDLSKNIKFLTLSSKIMFENKADVPLEFYDRATEQTLKMGPGKTLSLPCSSLLENLSYSAEMG
jgi:hypothetical protein